MTYIQFLCIEMPICLSIVIEMNQNTKGYWSVDSSRSKTFRSVHSILHGFNFVGIFNFIFSCFMFTGSFLTLDLV